MTRRDVPWLIVGLIIGWLLGIWLTLKARTPLDSEAARAEWRRETLRKYAS